jgi:hypothetical protein
MCGHPELVCDRDTDAARAQVNGDHPSRHAGILALSVVYTVAMADQSKGPGNEPAAPAGAPQIQIDVDDATAQGAYSNLVLINHNENEFVLDFAYIQPSAPRARVRARIISSPRHTKRLLRALEHNVRRYEERFGKIEEPEPMPPVTMPPGGLIS